MLGTKEKETSDDDERLQDELLQLVAALENTSRDDDSFVASLRQLGKLIKTSTSSMTAVPKPLKYLRNSYRGLKNSYEKLKVQTGDSTDASLRDFADIVSVLALAGSGSEQRECLKYCLEGTANNPGDWGHEYVRQLEADIIEECLNASVERAGEIKDRLMPLVESIVSFDVKHNAEIQACDLCMEIDQLDVLDRQLDENNCNRICNYLANCAAYSEETERDSILNRIAEYCLKFGEYSKAMLISLQLGDSRLTEKCLNTCTDPSMRNQLAFILARGQQRRPKVSIMPNEKDNQRGLEEARTIGTILSNALINPHFQNLARELDIVEPRHPEEICKSWHITTIPARITIEIHDSARANLAASFVTGFVHAGFGHDKLISKTENSWVHKNKELGMLSAMAALGLIHMWDVDGGLAAIDKSVPNNMYLVVFKNSLARIQKLAILNTKISVGASYRIWSSATNREYNMKQKVIQVSIAERVNRCTSVNLKFARNIASLAIVSHFLIGMVSRLVRAALVLTQFEGFTSLRYLYTSDDYVKSGALLAVGLVNCGVRNDCDPALALLSDYLQSNSQTIRIGAVLGLGIAYAGSQHSVVSDLLSNVLLDKESNLRVASLAAISLGLINVGSANPTISTIILQKLLELDHHQLADTDARFLPLALGIIFMGRRDAIDALLTALEVLPDPYELAAQTMLQICSYAGSGDVLMVQELLQICSEPPSSVESPNSAFHFGESSTRASSNFDFNRNPSAEKGANALKMDVGAAQAIATLGVAVVALGNGKENARIFGQIVRYGTASARRAVPLAMALSSLSNPEGCLIDLLNKYSHDNDPDVVHSAILALGLVGAGTNNARLAMMLRHLAAYHFKDPGSLFLVRISEGLVHLGKGTLSLCPLRYESKVLDNTALAALMVVFVACLDCNNLILGRSHYLLYCLAVAMEPRWLITVDENLQALPVSVRVGQAVDVVGKAGNPKVIKAGRVHTTPLLLAVGERAELVDDRYQPLSSTLEGFIVLREKPV